MPRLPQTATANMQHLRRESRGYAGRPRRKIVEAMGNGADDPVMDVQAEKSTCAMVWLNTEQYSGVYLGHGIEDVHQRISHLYAEDLPRHLRRFKDQVGGNADGYTDQKFCSEKQRPLCGADCANARTKGGIKYCGHRDCEHRLDAWGHAGIPQERGKEHGV